MGTQPIISGGRHSHSILNRIRRSQTPLSIAVSAEGEAEIQIDMPYWAGKHSVGMSLRDKRSVPWFRPARMGWGCATRGRMRTNLIPLKPTIG